MKILSGHYDHNSSFLIEDYPAGFTSRCQKLCWLEINNKGTRFCYQTSKKNGIGWNAVKCSTYMLFGVMFLDDNNHVQWTGLSPYDISKAKSWLEQFKSGLTETQIKALEVLISLYERQEAKKKEAYEDQLRNEASVVVSLNNLVEKQ